MKVKVTAYEGYLAIETLPPFTETDEFIPAGGTRFGCAIFDTKKNLGVSQEALDLLKIMKKSRDAIGDIQWFPSTEGKVFGWLGGPLVIKKAADRETCRDTEVFAEDCTIIPNDTPQAAIDAINALEKEQ